MSDAVIRNRSTKEIRTLSLEKDELKKLLSILQDRAVSAGGLEYQQNIVQNPDNSDSLRSNIQKCCVLYITLKGNQDDELFGTIEDVFNSSSFPEEIKSLYVNSELIYRTDFKYIPNNHFSLHLDFFKPKIFDFSLAPDERTPNNSKLEVQGGNATWVNGVFHEINSFIASKPSKYSIVHNNSAYSFVLWFIGMPLSFRLCYQVYTLFAAYFNQHTFLGNFILTYIFLLNLFLLRIFFHYIRWVYPMVEFRNKKSKSAIHQAAIYSIGIGLIGKVVYDIIHSMTQ